MRVAEQGGGDAEALAHTEAELLGLATGHGGETDHLEDFIDPTGRDLVGRREHPEMIAGLAGGVERLGLEQRSDVAHRMLDLPEGLAIKCRAAFTAVKTKHKPHRRGLSRTIGSEEAGHAAGMDDERQVYDSRFGPERLAQVLSLDNSHDT